jgi:hypothetical protein
MLTLLLDSYVLACPEPAEGTEAARQFISNLVGWRDIREAEWAETLLSVNAFDLLAQANYYPDTDRIVRMIESSRLPVQLRDIMVLINGILQKTPTFEDRYSRFDITPKSCTCSAVFLQDGRGAAFVAEFQRMLLHVAVATHIGYLHPKDVFAITRITGAASETVHLAACVDYCVSEPDALEFNCNVMCSTVGCATLAGLYLAADPQRMWVEASTVAVRRHAVIISVAQRGINVIGLPEGDPLYRWSFGRSFMETADRCGFNREENKARRLLRTIGDILLGQALQATHALRTGHGGNNPQLMRGADAAWRCDIDHEYHLHYWMTRHGPEFAAVVVHNDYSIPS